MRGSIYADIILGVYYFNLIATIIDIIIMIIISIIILLLLLLYSIDEW